LPRRKVGSVRLPLTSEKTPATKEASVVERVALTGDEVCGLIAEIVMIGVRIGFSSVLVEVSS
jgi:hypothetical protein